MEISITEAKKRLSSLILAVEEGEQIVITRNGKPVAALTRAELPGRKVKWGTMRGRIHLKPGWNAPMSLEQFIRGD